MNINSRLSYGEVRDIIKQYIPSFSKQFNNPDNKFPNPEAVPDLLQALWDAADRQRLAGNKQGMRELIAAQTEINFRYYNNRRIVAGNSKRRGA